MKFIRFISATRSEDNDNNPGGGVYVSTSIDIVMVSRPYPDQNLIETSNLKKGER